jgi:hypothetical protein
MTNNGGGAAAVLTHFICPALAVILSCAMNAAPICSIRQALEDGALGDLNPVPWALMTGNCVGWMAYSFLKTGELFCVPALGRRAAFSMMFAP